ncbi:hypothetical protein VPH35_029733 [Triticum aestivum]
MDAGGELNAAVAEPIGAIQYPPSPGATFDDDCDDLYGDVNLSFLPLPPLSPSPSSPPKTPSPGLSILSPSPSPPPRRNPSPKPQPEPVSVPEPPKKPTPQHQPPLPLQKPPSPRQPKAPTFRHQPPRRAPGGSTSSSPPTTALYIGDLPWWTTDAEVEAALAPHGALDGLYFYADKCSGRSRGSCRADFLHPAAAASAAAALHGRVFDGHHCVASLSCPPELRRFGADSDASAPATAPTPNPTQGRGGSASSVTTARGKVGSLGDGSAVGPMAPRPRQFAAMIGGGGGFPSSIGQYNAGMGTDAMPSVVPPHVNPAYLAASRMAMGGPGTGMWPNQGMAGGLWGGLQPWNFGGCDMSWQQQPRLQQHHRQVQQQYRNGNGGYVKLRGTGPGGRNQDKDIGNVRGNPDRRSYGRGGGGERPRERDRHREYAPERERGRERNWNDKDQHGGGEQKRYPQYTEHDDWERRGRLRSRSQSRDSDDDGDDHPRRRH